jgi:hypothetical protein
MRAASLLAVAALVAVGGCAGQSATTGGQANKRSSTQRVGLASRPRLTATASGFPPVSSSQASGPPVVSEPTTVGPRWRRVATVGGVPATWVAQRSGVTLLRFDQQLVHLALHAGLREPGGPGWVNGDRISASETHRVVAAFNGGFKLSYGSVGFFAYGRSPVPLHAGLGSIVTYADGTTGIGAWQHGVPATGELVVSVLQNLHLLVDRGVPAPNLESCIEQCWGKTVGGRLRVPRSSLGITASGQLVWAAGEDLTPAMLARALVRAGAVRAVQLDINPEWIAGYLYVHHEALLSPVALIPGQLGIPGALLTPYGRDFFTVLAN